MEFERHPFREWGTQYSNDIPYSQSWVCTICNWRFDIKFPQTIIGFSFEQPIASNWPRAGIVIVECLECNEKFWFHITESAARFYMMACDAWPKDPEAEELARIHKLPRRNKAEY